MIATTHWGECPHCSKEIIKGEEFVCIDGDFAHLACLQQNILEIKDLMPIRDFRSVVRRIELQRSIEELPMFAPKNQAEQLTLSL